MPEFTHTEESFAEAIRPTLKAFEKAAEPHIRKIADEVYDSLLGSVQDYLRENAEWNLGQEIRRFDLIQRENFHLHEVNRLLLSAARYALHAIENTDSELETHLAVTNLLRAAIAKATGAA